MNSYSWFIELLLQKGWSFRPVTEKQGEDLSSASNRALNLIKATPQSFQAFIQSFQELSSSGEDSWFLSYSDYLESNDAGFSWNEYEKLSIQATEEDGDDDEKAFLTEF